MMDFCIPYKFYASLLDRLRTTLSSENDKDKRLVFKNTHPTITSAETWEMVQKMRGHKRRYNSYGTQGLFSGILFCSDCGEKLYFNISRTPTKLSCSTYRKAQGNCTAHYIKEDTLAALDKLKKRITEGVFRHKRAYPCYHSRVY